MTSGAGTVFVIGGAEDKLGPRTVLRAFVDAACGHESRICVIPTASSLGTEVVDVYTALFRLLGAGEVTTARPTTRDEADDADLATSVRHASGVFMTGGNQLKLAQVVGGTGVGAAIAAVHAGGGVVGGTSAGASIVAEHMIAFGTGATTPRMRASQLWAGLGLVRGCVIDQHFAERGRYGRLLSLVAGSPTLLGIGVDEDTAAVIGPGETLAVLGSGAVTIFDARAAITNAHLAERGEPMLVSGVITHVLPAGSRFDLASRTLVAAHTSVPAREALEAAAAERDLRALADMLEDEAAPSSGTATLEG